MKGEEVHDKREAEFYRIAIRISVGVMIGAIIGFAIIIKLESSIFLKLSALFAASIIGGWVAKRTLTSSVRKENFVPPTSYREPRKRNSYL